MLTTLFVVLFIIGLAMLGWIFFGYPLFMYFWARIRPLPIRKDSALEPTITLLVPAYNESDVIRAKMQNSLSLNYPKEKLQILVVDDGSSDSTAAIVSEFVPQGVTLIRQFPRAGKMNAVNRGFSEASGEIVVLSDASPVYDSNALRSLARVFADPTIGIAVGSLLVWDAKNSVAKPASVYWKYEAALRRWESLTGSTVAVHGNMFAVRRSLYRPLIATTVNDEFSIAMETLRQGYRVIYEPAAISYDMASINMGDEFRRRARINAGRYQSLLSAGYLRAPTLDLTFRLFSHKFLRPLAAIFMADVFITNLLTMMRVVPFQEPLGLPPWVWQLLFMGQIGFYGLAAFGWWAEKRGIHIRYLSIPYFFVSSNAAALIGLWRWISHRQYVTWQKRIGKTL